MIFSPFRPGTQAKACAHLVIELDGSQHADAAGVNEDRERTRLIAARGYHVIRFWNARAMDGRNA